MNNKTLRILSIFFLLFLGFGGIYGAWMLISDPSGDKFGFQLDLLDKTPFSSYLLPGIILLIANGILPVYISILTIRKMQNYWWWIILQGLLLLGWLTLQLIFNPDFFVPLMHYLCYAIGMLLIILGVWGNRSNKNYVP